MSAISKAIATRNDVADRNLDAATEYARRIAVSELLPEAYRGKPQNVLVAAEYGRSVGIDPITSMQMVHIIKGKPTASAQLVNALVRRAGHSIRISGDANSATVEIVRSDDPDHPFTVTWTIDEARAAGLLSNPTWKNYPRAMLKARAVTECARDACPEALAGIAYTAEEVGAPLEVIAEQVETPELEVTDAGVANAETGELFDVEVVE